MSPPVSSFETLVAANALGGPQPLAAFPASNTRAPLVVCLPALGIAGRYYTGLGRALAERGVHAVLADLAGGGESPVVASRHTDWLLGRSAAS